MAHINPAWPGDGDPGWGDTLNTGLSTVVNQLNAHDDQIANLSGTTTPPSATSTTQGIVQLAGDLAGVASAPAVRAIKGVTITNAPTPGQVLTATSPTSANWADDTGNDNRVTWASAADGSPVSADLPLPAFPDYSSRALLVTVASKANHDGVLRTRWLGHVFITSKVNAVDSWQSDQVDIVAPTGFISPPVTSVTKDTADAVAAYGRLTVAFTPNDTDGYGEVSYLTVG